MRRRVAKYPAAMNADRIRKTPRGYLLPRWRVFFPDLPPRRRSCERPRVISPSTAVAILFFVVEVTRVSGPPPRSTRGLSATICQARRISCEMGGHRDLTTHSLRCHSQSSWQPATLLANPGGNRTPFTPVPVNGRKAPEKQRPKKLLDPFLAHPIRASLSHPSLFCLRRPLSGRFGNSNRPPAVRNPLFCLDLGQTRRS